MKYLTATQVKNILAKRGIPRGRKVSQTEPASNGVVVYEDSNGWVRVLYSNKQWATTDGVSLEKHNDQMSYLINFILTEMHGFEAMTGMKYRKATS